MCPVSLGVPVTMSNIIDTAMRKLGETLSLYETQKLSRLISKKKTMKQACNALGPKRGVAVLALLEEAGLHHGEEDNLHKVLAGLVGAKASVKEPSAVWTLPNNLPFSVATTDSVRRMIKDAQLSVTCSTYNYTDSSNFHKDLQELMSMRDVAVTIYVDGSVGNPSIVKIWLPEAHVYFSTPKPASDTGQSNHETAAYGITSHAKFIIVDRRYVFVTSANLSLQAEHFNIELGVKIDDARLAVSIEDQMKKLRASTTAYGTQGVYQEVK